MSKGLLKDKTQRCRARRGKDGTTEVPFSEEQPPTHHKTTSDVLTGAPSALWSRREVIKAGIPAGHVLYFTSSRRTVNSLKHTFQKQEKKLLLMVSFQI